MERLLNTAFDKVEIIGPHVVAGRYDLINENGDIILPRVWDDLVEPDWKITMHMWPMPVKQEASPQSPPPSPPPPPPEPATATASTSTTTPPSPGPVSGDPSKVPRRLSTPNPSQTPSQDKSSASSPTPKTPSSGESDPLKKSISKDRQSSKSRKHKSGEAVKTAGSIFDWVRGKPKRSSKRTSMKRDPAKPT